MLKKILRLFISFSLCVSVFIVSVHAQPCDWHLDFPYAEGAGYHAAWCSSGTDYFIAGDKGTILHYDGTTLEPMMSGTAMDLYSLWGNSSSEVYAAGDLGTVLSYDGASWTYLFSITPYPILGMWGTSSGHLFFAAGSHYDPLANNGSIVHYNGLTWTTWNWSTYLITDIWGFSATDVWASAYGLRDEYPDHDVWGGILHYDGASWTLTTSEYGLRRIWGSSSSDMYAVGYTDYDYYTYNPYGVIVHYDGSSWSEIYGPKTPLYYEGQFEAVWGYTDHEVYVGSLSGRILQYDGFTWRNFYNASSKIEDIFGSSAANLMFAGSEIHHYDGTSWTVLLFRLDNDFESVWASSPDDVFVGTGPYWSPRYILHYDGITWKQMTGPGAPDSYIFDFWGTSGTDVYAVGWANVFHYDGSTWETLPVSVDPGIQLQAIWGSSSTDIFVVGEIGTVLHYDGITWTDIWRDKITDLYDVWGSSWNNVYAVGADGSIVRYNGTTWKFEPVLTSGTHRSIWGFSASSIFVDGWFHYDGSTWTTIDYPMDTVMDLWGTSPTDLWAACLNHRIKHYDGASWSTSYDTSFGIEFLGIWGTSPYNVYGVGEEGLIMHYDCGTWKPVPMFDKSTIHVIALILSILPIIYLIKMQT